MAVVGGTTLSASLAGMQLIQEHDTEKRAVHLDVSIVFNETEAAKPVHEETNASARSADHVSESVLTDRRGYRLLVGPPCRN
jgi:hypothetical protein